MFHKSFDQAIKEMKQLGDLLTQYNFPKVPITDEDDINFIKSNELTVDGYNIILHYNKSEYEDHYLETLQILGKYTPFLPFNFVCKIGKKILGDKCLSLVQFFRDSKKIYCWTLITNKQGEPILGSYKSATELCNYEGFEYRSLATDQVNFY